jgi:hypothetical protein
MNKKHALKLLVGCGLAVLALAFAYQTFARHLELPNAVLEEAPYNEAEAGVFPPPWESSWEGTNNPGKCSGCHTGMFDMWNGSMMANSWRDPIWRGAFFLLARATATDGNCDIPNPPDATARNLINPFANGDCTSTFDLAGTQTHTTSGSGSLLDEFCSACHMPTNYVDNVAPDGTVDPLYDPTSAAGTGSAFATVSAHYANTEAGKRGIFCKVCHSMTGSRYTPYHNYVKSGTDYVPAVGTGPRDSLLPLADQDLLNVADPLSDNLGYAIGARAYKLSPHAIERPERFGPLTFNDYTGMVDPYVGDVFNITFNYELGDFSRHDGFYTAFMERAEWCGMCHDVTNPLPIKNPLGYWVGGFPIERTYSEYRNSRYADRPGNPNYDANFKRDCQTCHMQQHYGQPGTAQTLYEGGAPVAPIQGNPCDRCTTVPVFYTHHFVGGNAYLTRMIGAAVSNNGAVQPYPELSDYSYSSADPDSVYHHAYFENVGDKGPRTQHERMAWDRLRNALDVTVSGPASAGAGTTQAVTITVDNSGAGHNFPTGFPEARNGWVAVRAWDIDSGAELDIFDSVWSRTSTGVGYLTAAEIAADPNFPGCNWHQPAGAPDPYAYQFRAVGSLGDGCPTLALPYARPLNMDVNADGVPVDAGGVAIDGNNPEGLPVFNDVDGDGDLYDDAYLVDNRLRPMPHADASVTLGRYSVVIPAGTVGPVAVTAAVYYQSVEAVVSVELLGNLADTDTDGTLEPCVLGGACDGRTPTTEPAVVEGAPPVPVEVASWVIEVDTDVTPPAAFFMYPLAGAVDAYDDLVVKVGFSEPVVGIDETTFALTDGGGLTVPAYVDQISDGVWGLFPHDLFLPNDTYTATVSAPICDVFNNCLQQDVVWSFTTSSANGTGDTSVPIGFGAVVVTCGDAFCDAGIGEDQCTCPQDCGTPPANEVPNSTCFDTLDNDCDGDTDCADADCFGIDPQCPATDCGDGICDTTPGSGEDCVTCPQDCNGVQGGKPTNRFCCGDGGGQNPVDCNDPRCSEGSYMCI